MKTVDARNGGVDTADTAATRTHRPAGVPEEFDETR